MRVGRIAGAVPAAALAFLVLCGCGAVRETIAPAPPAGEPPVPARATIDNVPFLPPQEDTCGPTALGMLLRFLGKEVDPAELVRETRIEGLRGVLITDLAAAAARRGVPMKVEKLSIARLRAEVAAGTPVILLADLGAWRVSAPHYMLVYGYTPHGVIAHSGKARAADIAYATLDRQWTRMGGLALVVRGRN